MCGIAGYLGLNDRELLLKMTNILIHRGPDDWGIFTDNNIGLGMRRLSIIDLSSGKQPIHNEDNTIWVVFNGEIYNYRELREKLESLGHTFYTNSDTEVIVHAYEEYGVESFLKFRGMFAYVIWDGHKKNLILARDRLGIKPLYYAIFDNILLFASEIKAILKYKEYTPKINFQAISDYLTYLYVPAPYTAYQNIFKLLPGNYLNAKIENNKLKIDIRNYWDLSFDPKLYQRSEDYYVNKIKLLLEESIRYHMISDVPIGVYLSGGLDSTTIVALLTQFSEEPLKTYTVGFYESEENETYYAQYVAEYYNTEHYEYYTSSDAFKLIPKVIEMHDEPFGNPTTIINYLISKKISKHVKVALSGAGGDELFGGYPKYFANILGEYYFMLPNFLKKMFSRLVNYLPESKYERDYFRWLKMFINASYHKAPLRYYSLVEYFKNSDKMMLLNNNLFKHVSNSFWLINNLFKVTLGKPLSYQIYYAEIKSFLPYNILEYSDKSSMISSLEARVPFLDNELVTFMASIPLSLKLKHFKLKYLLQKAVKDILPKKVLTRKKKGFNPPTALWIVKDILPKKVLTRKKKGFNPPTALWINKELIENILLDGVLIKNNIINQKYLNKLIRLHNDGKKNCGLLLFGLIILDEWFKTIMN